MTGDARIRPDSRLTAADIERLEASGTWVRRSLRSLLTDAAARFPDRLAAVGYRAGRLDKRASLGYAALDGLASRLSAGLRSLGLGPGDVIAVMLPNRVEFPALVYAINEAGATYTGIPSTYGAREVGQILRQSGARAVVVEEGDPARTVRGLRAGLPALEHTVVVPAEPGGAAPELPAGETPYDALLEVSVADPADDFRALAHIGYTSGTTGSPKGVMNTSQPLEAILRNWVEHVGGPKALGEPMVNLVASPVGHHTGFCWGVLLTAYLGGTAVYLDRWDPALAAGIVGEQAVTTMFCAPTFVQDLVEAAESAELQGGSLRMITVAGAPIPRSLPEAAGDVLDCAICPAWGMTEYAIAISWAPRLGTAALATDGVPVPGAEIRVVTSGGAAEPDEPGELQMRGAGLFIGYHGQPEEAAATSDDGWFSTGDTAVVDRDGLVSLVGRMKDIVIRGGENIPVVEVESLLYEHPKVRDVAIVGVPDPRLGQRACAVLVASPAESPTLPELCDWLLERGLSKRFLPERLELVDALPKTASGKVRKVELRQAFS